MSSDESFVVEILAALDEAGIEAIVDRISGGLDFQGLRARSAKIDLGQVTAVVASLEDVIASKQAAGRPKDLGQLPVLLDTLKVLRSLESK